MFLNGQRITVEEIYIHVHDLGIVSQAKLTKARESSSRTHSVFVCLCLCAIICGVCTSTCAI